MLFRNIVIVLLAAFFLTACSSVPRFTRYSKKEHPPSIRYEKYSNYKVLETVEGIASYYADKYQGRTTSSGEKFDMYELTAAHSTYPFDTIIRVIDLTNGRSVIIRVNDRFPENPGRIIDLSYGSAKELDMLRAGITRVRLEILKWGG